MGFNAFLCVFSKDLNPKSTVMMWLYLGLYGLQSILLIMNIFILLVKIWLSRAFVCNKVYKHETHLLVFIHCFMKTSLLFFIYIIFLTFILAKKMEYLNINGDNGAASQRSNLTQAELLDLCLVGRVVVNKPVHLATLEARLGPMWEPKYQMSLILMEDNKFMVQVYSKADLVKILDSSPWLLDNNMITLKKVVVGENPPTLSMNTTEIWAPIQQLSFGFMDDNVGALVGSYIGKMIKFDEENNYGPWRRYMRV